MRENEKADNLKLGAIYKNARNDEPMRLIQILPCEGVWMEAADGNGFAHTLKFEDVLYASPDEVQDFLEDLAVFTGSDSAPSHKEPDFLPAIEALQVVNNFFKKPLDK